jgi:hypothetical protein
MLERIRRFDPENVPTLSHSVLPLNLPRTFVRGGYDDDIKWKRLAAIPNWMILIVPLRVAAMPAVARNRLSRSDGSTDRDDGYASPSSSSGDSRGHGRRHRHGRRRRQHGLRRLLHQHRRLWHRSEKVQISTRLAFSWMFPRTIAGSIELSSNNPVRRESFQSP